MKTRTTAALLFTALLAGPVLAATCDIEIEGNDAMQFNKSAIAVPASCKQFTVKLKHVGKLPKASMGHNWVLSKAAATPCASAALLSSQLWPIAALGILPTCLSFTVNCLQLAGTAMAVLLNLSLIHI